MIVVRASAESVAGAYTASAASWQNGPGRIYDVLAEHLVDGLAVTAADVALDVGAGTGAATRHLRRRGATVVPLDVAHGMLAAGGESSSCAVVGDARRLPFADGSFDVAVAAFSLNHVPDPVIALGEVRRVLRLGGRFVAAVYATDDAHHAKAEVDAVAAEFGWCRPAWFDQIRRVSMPSLATAQRASMTLHASGLRGTVEVVEVPIPGLTPRQLVDWRLGMAQLAPFVSSLTEPQRQRLRHLAEVRLGDDPQPLVRRVVQLRAVR